MEKDIVYFIKDRGTGQEIPDPPRFINFCKEEPDDAASDIDTGEGYSVAQFQRTMNPAFRTSSPQPSTFESHHDPQSDLAAQMGHPAPPPANVEPPQQQPQPQPQPQHPAPLDLRRGGYLPPNYDPEQHGEINQIPHNSYPTDGMTMFCRPGPPSERSSATSAYRPSSRDSQSEVSNPTSMSSVEQQPVNMKPAAPKPMSAAPPPKPMNNPSPPKPMVNASPPKPVNNAPPSNEDEKQTPKKKTAFFSNSPFRRKSRHEKDRPAITAQPPARRPWNSPSKQASPPKPAAPSPQPERHAPSPEPVDPRANFQLNVGNNVFDVASPEKNAAKPGSQQAKGAEDDMDPIARALADLKTTGKQSSVRVSADRYHGIQTPTPSAPSSSYEGSSSGAPPAYNDQSVKRLGAPEPAFTAKQMQKTTQRYTGQTQNMFRGGSNNPSMAAPRAQEVPRAKSPAPSRRSASPQVSPRVDTRASPSGGGASPSPSAYQSSSMRSRYSQSPTPRRAQDPPYSPNDFARRPSPAATNRAVSPQPQFRQQPRPSSAGGMELQLSGQPDMYGGGGSQSSYSSPRRDGRPMSYYGDGGGSGGGNSGGPPIGRSRSRTLAVAEPGRKFSRDGRPILHFGKNPSLYSPSMTNPMLICLTF